MKVPYGLRDTNQIFAAGLGREIHRDRGVSRDGAIVVVRPDMYVAAVLPISARRELTEYFCAHMLPPTQRSRPEPIRSIHDRIRL